MKLHNVNTNIGRTHVGAGLKPALKITILLSIFLIFITGVTAQEEKPVTFDEVNEIASKMYCPICENEPLDACGVPTCVEWREEIRDQLADGRTEEQIIDYFVTNYGDRVLGIPEDNTLRIYSFAGPILLIFVALVIGIWTAIKWRSSKPITIADNSHTDNNDDYRSRLETDLQ